MNGLNSAPETIRPPANRQPFTPPRLVTYTDEQLLEVIGPAVAGSNPNAGLFNPSDPYNTDPYVFPGD